MVLRLSRNFFSFLDLIYTWIINIENEKGFFKYDLKETLKGNKLKVKFSLELSICSGFMSVAHSHRVR